MKSALVGGGFASGIGRVVAFAVTAVSACRPASQSAALERGGSTAGPSASEPSLVGTASTNGAPSAVVGPSVDAAPGAGSAIPASVRTLHATAVGAPHDLRVDEAGVSFCDDRGARRLTAGAPSDERLDRPCAKDTEPNAACGNLPLDVTVAAPGLGPDNRVEVTSGSNTQTFMVRGQVLDCAAHDQVVAVALGDRAVLLNARTGRTETVYGAAMRIALGADWLAWTEGSDVRARRRGAADGLAPATMPSPVLYKTVRGGDFRVDIPTFFEESSTPHGGSWTWAWESATLEASAASMDSGATPATMCAEMVRNVAHVVSSQATKTGCFVTGTSGASILWKREQYRCGRRFRLAFEYDAALKADFDPIVSHVNASWQLQLDAGSCP